MLTPPDATDLREQWAYEAIKTYPYLRHDNGVWVRDAEKLDLGMCTFELANDAFWQQMLSAGHTEKTIRLTGILVGDALNVDKEETGDEPYLDWDRLREYDAAPQDQYEPFTVFASWNDRRFMHQTAAVDSTHAQLMLRAQARDGILLISNVYERHQLNFDPESVFIYDTQQGGPRSHATPEPQLNHHGWRRFFGR